MKKNRFFWQCLNYPCWFMILVIATCFLFLCSVGYTHEWTSSSGKHKTVADLFSIAKDGSDVVLLKPDGNLVKVASNKLSQQDNMIIKEYLRINLESGGAVKSRIIDAETLEKIISETKSIVTPEMFKNFLKKAEEGLPDAQFLAGSCYLLGLGTTENMETGKSWLAKASAQGFEAAGEVHAAVTKIQSENPRSSSKSGVRIGKGVIRLILLAVLVIGGVIWKAASGRK